ncbi:Ankyrin-3 [Arthrobotrys entomopaga]|nr:Ankyrin-3 [Arthrobotrys entomopaga]
MVANEPLRLTQIVEAIADLRGENNFYDEEALVQEDDIIELCSSLIKVDPDDQTVHFSHYSVKLFLADSKLLETDGYSHFYFDGKQEDYMAAKFCLTYLCLDNFNVGYVYEKDTYYWNRTKFAFYQYAEANWFIHAARCDTDEPLSLLLQQFLAPEKTPNFLYWLQSIFLRNAKFSPRSNLKDVIDKIVPKDITTLHIAAGFGLLRTVDWMIELHSMDLNSTSRLLATPLICALLGPCIVQLNDEINVSMALSIVPPTTYADVNRTEVVIKLVTGGANINTAGETRNGSLTPLGILVGFMSFQKFNTTIMELFKKGHLRFTYYEVGLIELISTFEWIPKIEIAKIILESTEDSLSAEFRQRLIDLIIASKDVESKRLVTRLLENEILNGDYPSPPQCPDKDFPDNGTSEAVTGIPEIVDVKAQPFLQKDFKYVQLLQSTSGGGNLSALKKLLKFHGSRSINNCAKNGRSALHEACIEGHIAIVTMLLDSGANINTTSISPYGTALHYACLSNHAELVRVLLSRGADLNARDKIGRTPLMAMWKYSNVIRWASIVKYLLEQSHLDFTVVDTYNCTYLHYAAAFGDFDDLKRCCEKGLNVRARAFNLHTTPLHLAVINNKPADQIQYLLEKGASVDDLDDNGDTPLHFAKRADLVELLLQNGARLSIKNKDGLSPGHMACMFAEDPKILQHMAATCDVKTFANHKTTTGGGRDNTSKGMTMLHLAALRDGDDAALRLVTYLCTLEGVDPNVVAENSYTPLICTILGMRTIDPSEGDFRASNMSDPRRSYIMELLLQMGADPYVQLHEGDFSASLLGLAVERGYLPGVEVLLKQPGFDVNQPVKTYKGGMPALSWVAFQAHLRPDIAKVLIESGADVNARISDLSSNEYDESALHSIANMDYPTYYHLESAIDMARLLLAHGADIDAHTSRNFTPLAGAVFAQNTPLARFLLENGAHAQTKAGGSVIFLLAAHPDSWNEEMFDLLISQMVDINDRDDNGFPLLRHAIFYANIPFVEKILEAGADISGLFKIGKVQADVITDERWNFRYEGTV